MSVTAILQDVIVAFNVRPERSAELSDEDLSDFHQRLGLPGFVDIHVHFMPERVLRKVWDYFDRVPAKAGSEWPIRYRFDEPTTIKDLFDWHGRCAALARQKPRWVPGEKTAYHPITYGFLAGEIVRRACGRRSIGEFVQQELATPLAADFFIGLEPALQRRAAETLMPKNLVDPSALPSIEETRGSVTNPMLHPQAANTAAWRQAEMPALNGHASAEGIARIYAMLANGGVFERHKLLSPATIARMTQVLSHRMELTLGMEANWAAGVRMPERPTRKLAPTRGAIAKPAPSDSTYETPMPRPRKPKAVRLNGR